MDKRIIQRNLTRIFNKRKRRLKGTKLALKKGFTSSQFWNSRDGSKESVRRKNIRIGNGKSRKKVQSPEPKSAIHVGGSSNSRFMNNSFKQWIIPNKEIFSERQSYYNSSYIKQSHQVASIYEENGSSYYQGSSPGSPIKSSGAEARDRHNFKEQLSRKADKINSLFKQNDYNKKDYSMVRKNISTPYKSKGEAMTRNNFNTRGVMSAGDQQLQGRWLSQPKRKIPNPHSTFKLMSNASQKQKNRPENFGFQTRGGKLRKFKNNLYKKLKYSNTQKAHGKSSIHYDISTGGQRRFSRVSKLEPYNLLAIPNISPDFFSTRYKNNNAPNRSFTNSTSKQKSDQ